ncbi:MAG: symmetrical bis(5'-nucleosyl)-tetraphosphatase [Gammaproteobacteria bacterium]
MPHYAIGDIQGCFDPLQRLLKKINFDPTHDHLWLVGDLVNRGSQSLAVLRFLKSLSSVRIVLGNHDLHFLAVAHGFIPLGKHDTFQDVLNAPDCIALCDWLRQQPLLQYDPHLQYVMTHAGILPTWTLDEAIQYAQEIQIALKNPEALLHLYGDLPDHWSPHLQGWDRLRFICNVFTRMRFCTPDGGLDLKFKGKPGEQETTHIPWFHSRPRTTQSAQIIFGHWASLNGETHEPRIHALDTGCAWGNTLTAMRLEDQQRFEEHLSCKLYS